MCMCMTKYLDLHVFHSLGFGEPHSIIETEDGRTVLRKEAYMYEFYTVHN